MLVGGETLTDAVVTRAPRHLVVKGGRVVARDGACAMVGWKAAGFSLGLAALALINAIGFHVLPSLRAGAPNPGLFTAAALYVPIGIWAYVAASSDDRLSFGAFVLSVLVGATVMAAAVGMLILGRDYGYADAAEDEAGPPPIPGTHAEAETGGDDGD